MRIAVLTSGSLSGASIEPETSSRNTRLRGGVRSLSMRLRLQTDERERDASEFHGHAATSVVTEKGSPFCGCGYEKWK